MIQAVLSSDDCSLYYSGVWKAQRFGRWMNQHPERGSLHGVTALGCPEDLMQLTEVFRGYRI
jgi:hypothetical protein